jgi:hypothetical protein
MTSNQRGLYALGDTHATMGRNKGLQNREVKLIPKNYSQFGLQAATRLHEAGIASNRRSAMLR